jgi:TolB-like protein
MKSLCAVTIILITVILFSCTKSPENIAELTSPIVYSMTKNLISQHKTSGEMNIKVIYSNLKMQISEEWPTGEIECSVEFSEYKGKIAKIHYILDGTHNATAIVEIPGKDKKQVKVNLYENAVIFGQAQTVENKILELSSNLAKKLDFSYKIAIFDFVGLQDENTIFGKRISESLITYLSQSNYKIVERKLLDQIFKEKSFQLTGVTGENLRNEIGKFLGADCILTGTIKLEKEEVIVNSRVIDLKNGTILSSAQIIFPKYLVRPSDLNRIN